MFKLDYMVQARGLAKRFPTRAGAVEAVRGVDIDVGAGRDRRLPRPQRRGQDDHAADAHHAARARRRARRPSPGTTSRARRRSGCAGSIGYVGQSGGTTCREALVGEELVDHGRLLRHRGPWPRRAAARCLDELDLDGTWDRPLRRRCPAASGAASTSRWGWSTSRRWCSSTSRPPGSIRRPRQPVGAHPRAARRARHHRVPHHPLPRRGRRAVRPHPGHRPRRDRRRRARRPSSSARCRATSSLSALDEPSRLASAGAALERIAGAKVARADGERARFQRARRERPRSRACSRAGASAGRRRSPGSRCAGRRSTTCSCP